MSSFVSLEDVKKIYQMGEVQIMAAAGIDFQIERGEFAVVVGPSGAGKTTVLNILGGMDTASSGRVIVDGKDIAQYSPRQLTAYRRDDIGFVFQFYNLVQNLTALENVELALQICKDPLDAREVLTDVGLQDRMLNFPAQLSGGEQQRVAIARALAKNPKLLLCDEPTGALAAVFPFSSSSESFSISGSMALMMLTTLRIRRRVRSLRLPKTLVNNLISIIKSQTPRVAELIK